jgi:hypothetical protein
MADGTSATSDLKAVIDKVETILLSEFRKLARNNDAQLRSVNTRIVDVSERLTLIDERVSKLERRRKAS